MNKVGWGGVEEKGTHPNPPKVKPKDRNPERKREKREEGASERDKGIRGEHDI